MSFLPFARFAGAVAPFYSEDIKNKLNAISNTTFNEVGAPDEVPIVSGLIADIKTFFGFSDSEFNTFIDASSFPTTNMNDNTTKLVFNIFDHALKDLRDKIVPYAAAEPDSLTVITTLISNINTFVGKSASGPVSYTGVTGATYANLVAVRNALTAVYTSMSATNMNNTFTSHHIYLISNANNALIELVAALDGPAVSLNEAFRLVTYANSALNDVRSFDYASIVMESGSTGLTGTQGSNGKSYYLKVLDTAAYSIIKTTTAEVVPNVAEFNITLTHANKIIKADAAPANPNESFLTGAPYETGKTVTNSTSLFNIMTMTKGHCAPEKGDSLLMDILRNNDPVNANRSISEFTSTLTNSKLVAQDICNVGVKLNKYLTFTVLKDAMEREHGGVAEFVDGDKLIIYLKYCTEVLVNNFVTLNTNGSASNSYKNVTNLNTNLTKADVETRLEAKVYKLQFNIMDIATPTNNTTQLLDNARSSTSTYGADQVFMYDNSACEDVFGKSDSSINYAPIQWNALSNYVDDFSSTNTAYTETSYDVATATIPIFDKDYEIDFAKQMGIKYGAY